MTGALRLRSFCVPRFIAIDSDIARHFSHRFDMTYPADR